MTENEAIKVFKELLDVPCEMLVKYDSVTTEEQKNALVKIRVAEDMAIQALEEIQQYRAIGTIDEFKALKEKNEPKKPIKHGSYYVCPCCGNTEIEYCNEVDCRTIRLKRCTLCGQKLD